MAISQDTLSLIKNFSPEAQQRALELLYRKSQGGRIVLAYEDPQARAAYERIAATSYGRRQLTEGSAKAFGFKSSDEQAQYEKQQAFKREIASGQVQSKGVIPPTKTTTKFTGSNIDLTGIGTTNPEAQRRIDAYAQREKERFESEQLIKEQERFKREGFSPSATFQGRQDVARIEQRTITPAVKEQRQNLEMVEGTRVDKKETRTDLAPQKDYGEVKTRPYLTREIIGTAVDPATGKSIPIYGEVKYIDPTVIGQQYERKATPEEIEEYEAGTRVLEASTDKRNFIERGLGEVKGTFQQDVYEINKANSNKFQEWGLTDANIDFLTDYIAASSPLSRIFPNEQIIYDTKNGVVSLKENPIADFQSSVMSSIIKDIRDRPLQNVATFGLGAGAGFIIKGGKLGFRYLTAGGGLSKIKSLQPLIDRAALALNLGFVTYVSLPTIKSLAVEDLTAKERGEQLGLLSKDVLLFTRGYRVGELPYQKKFYLSYNQPEFNYGLDIIQPIQVAGREIQVGKFGIKGKVPKATIYSDTPIKEFFRDLGVGGRLTGLKFEKELKGYNVSSRGAVITEEGKILYGKAVSGREGFSAKQFTFIEGEQIQFDILNFKELSRLEQFNFKKAIQFGKADDITNYFRGELNINKAYKTTGIDYATGKISPNANILISYAGKRVSRFSTISEVVEFLKVEEQFTIYKTKIGLKDITFPNARATGKIVQVEGYSKVLEPRVLETDGGQIGFKGGGQKTKFNQESINKLLIDIQGTKGSIVKDIIKNAKGRADKQLSNVRLEEINRINRLPTMVGGGGQEKREVFSGMTFTYQTQEPLALDMTIQKALSKQSPEQRTRIYNVEIEKSISKNLNKEITKNINKEIVKEITKNIQKEQQKTIQKEVLKQITKTPPPISEVVKYPSQRTREKYGNFNLNIKGASKGELVSGFVPYVKVRGKDIAIGGVQERGSALRAIEKYLRETLSASGKIVATKEKVKGTETRYTPSSGYRQGRIVKGQKQFNPFIVIEKSGTKFNKDLGGSRLETKSEINKILSYRRRKK